jgi:hypothetical protein
VVEEKCPTVLSISTILEHYRSGEVQEFSEARLCRPDPPEAKPPCTLGPGE